MIEKYMDNIKEMLDDEKFQNISSKEDLFQAGLIGAMKQEEKTPNNDNDILTAAFTEMLKYAESLS